MAKKIITTYLLVSLIATFLSALHAAVYVTYLLQSGLSLFEVSLVNLFFMVSAFLLEIPTGAVADLWGRKFSFILSSIINGIGFFVYSMADSFSGFIIAEIIIALGMTLMSGALRAWLVDSLHFVGWNGRLIKIFHLEGRVINLARLSGGLIGAYLGIKNLSVPFAIAGVGYWLLAIISYSIMQEDYFQKKSRNGKEVVKDIKQIVQDSIVYGFKDNTIFLIVAVTILFTLGFQSFNMFWQPKYGPLLLNTQQFGFIWAGIVIFTAIGNELVRFFWVHVPKIKTAYLIIGVSLGMTMILAGIIPVFALSLIWFYAHEIVRGVYQPYTSAVLHERIPSDKRATVESFVSMMRTGAAALGLILAGWASERLGIEMAWILSGIMIIAFLPLGMLLNGKRINKSAH